MNTTHSKGRNPVLDIGVHIADPEAHIMPDGRVYVYGSLDTKAEEFSSDRYRVYSSANMREWTDHGESFRAEQVLWTDAEDSRTYPGNRDWLSHPTPFMQKVMAQWGAAAAEQSANGQAEEGAPEPKARVLFAPDAIEKDGSYYLYFCCNDDSEGVAVSRSPEGPFQNAARMRCNGIDPAVFVDYDGQAYFYWGQFTLSGAKLEDNMMALNQESIVSGLLTEEEHFFHEGSSMRRRGDTYYLVFADMERGRPNALGYATGKSPLGPFTYQGIIVDASGCDPASWNNHGSIEEVNGQWYVFYHRNSRCCPSMRRLCVEPIFFDGNGLIAEVEMTSQGAGAPFGAGEEVPFFRACLLTGMCRFVPDEKLGEVLSGIEAGNSATFKYFDFSAAPSEVSIYAQGSGKVEVKCNGDEIATIFLTDGWNSCGISTPLIGKQSLEVVFHQASDDLRCGIVKFN
jgi:hypothetical protein